MNDKDGPAPYANSKGHGATGPWLTKTTTTTRVTTTTTESHFFPLFRRRPNNPPQAAIETGRDKALPAPPPQEEDAIGLGTPGPRIRTRDLTPRALTQRDRNVTPTPPFPQLPTVTPPTPITQRKASKDIRKVRSSGTLRDILPAQPRRSEHTDRTAPYSELPPIVPPRGRQPAISSPSLSQSQAGRTLSPPVAPTRQTMIYTGTQTWLDREQGRLTWESQRDFGFAEPGSVTSHSLGSRDQHQRRERARRPSAPASPNIKGKAKEIEAAPQEAGRRSILGRRPSFWSRKPKSKLDSASAALAPEAGSPAAKRSLEVPKAGPSRSSTSFEDPMSPRSSTYSPRPGASSHSSVHRINSRPSTDKLSTLQKSNNNSRLTLSSPRGSVESRPSVDLTLPNVRASSPLFTEYGTYRASVDFAAAGGPSLMARTKRLKGDEQVITEEGAPTTVNRPDSTSSHPTETAPVPIPGTHTPPRRRMTNNSSVGRAQSWRRSLVESARNLIGASSNASLDGGDDVLSGSPAQGLVGSPVQGSPIGTASSSPIPWVNISTSPRASGSRSSPVPPLSLVASPPPQPITGSLRSRHGSPIPNGMMSPTTAQRVTFGDNPQPSRGRTGSITAAISNWRGNSGADDGNGGTRGIRRAKSTSKLTAALPLTRRRSFSLFGPRPGSAGQAHTQAQVAREREMKGSALGHSHPSAFGPATEPAFMLSPPMLAPGSVFASPQPMPMDALTPGTPGTPLTGSQLSLGGPAWGGSSIGHSGGSQFGSNTNVSGTTTAGGASRTSSILLRSPLRPRSSTNPPLLRRLSGVFGSASGGGFTRTGSGDLLAARQADGKTEGSALSSRPGSSGKPVITRVEGDTPEVFLQRLLETVSKNEIASAIASKNDPFHLAALTLYMERFNFELDPLDIALRRLLMELNLPKETQQIDRVMEAFAKRYTDCNPGLFASEDQAYVLAFSLMMLHTDAFNKSNKNKMTKADYVKNTRMPGLPSEVLDYFFDNIVFAPFIFIEDATDVNGQRGFVERGSVTPVSNPSNSGTLLSSRPKIDPHYIITQNLLDPLRVPIGSHIPPVSPLSYTGTADSLDVVQLRRVFASNSQLEIAGTGAEPVRIGVNKLGLLSRKDDLLEGGRRAASRKWRRWAVVLTGSQLLLFRETAWASLDPQQPSAETSSLRPEEVVSLKDAVALYDTSYEKYSNVFRFILPTGRQQLMQAANEQDMNEWIARINYASALKSAGVRVRELAMNAEETRATGVAAAVSHVRDQRRGKASPPSWSNEELDCTQQSGPKIMENRSGMSSEVELDVIVEPSDGGMKDTFDEIKAQLAVAHPLPMSGLAPPVPSKHRGQDKARTRITTRAEAVLFKIKDLEEKIDSTHVQLQNELRIARNFAVLAPFQQATRNRIRLAFEALARRVQAIRMDMAKTVCHRDVLASDLAAEEEERERLRAVALEAARQQLLLTVPRMMLSVHDGVLEEEPERRPSPSGSDVSASRASPAWSFRSSDYPDPNEEPTLVAKRDTSLTTPENEVEQLAPSPRKSEASLQPRPSFAASVSSRSGISSNGDGHGLPTGTAVTEEGTEELAEEWHATRAGRRVSLVQIPQPSDKQKLAELIRQHTHSKQTLNEGVKPSS